MRVFCGWGERGTVNEAECTNNIFLFLDIPIDCREFEAVNGVTFFSKIVNARVCPYDGGDVYV